jgi:hypothetical protein
LRGERFLLELTADMPEGYFFYVPSFTKATIASVKKKEGWTLRNPLMI